MKGLVFAAGMGTRLRPLTDSMPKALVEVGGMPMLERIIRKLAAAGVSPVVVNACHFSGMITDFLASKDFGVKVAVSLESGPQPLETGGGIRHAESLLAGGGRFLVHNVDILSDADLSAFIASDRPGDFATLMLQEKPADRVLLFDDEIRLVGWRNTVTGELKSPYAGLDPSSCMSFSFCGIHIISDEVFGLMRPFPESFGIIDFYLSVCARKTVRGVVVPGLDLIDIGTPEKLRQAQESPMAQR